MGEFGLKIKNISAGMLYECNLGIRDYWTYSDAMLNNSLFYYYMLDHGLKTYKGDSTRDIICLKFDFGSKSYKEERRRVLKLIKDAKTDEDRGYAKKVLEKVDANKSKYREMSREDIRKKFYEDGVDVVYETRDHKTGEVVKKETIHYSMLYRTPAKAKLGEVMFINSDLYETAHDWLTMGIKLPDEHAKIVEMSAYAPLTTSTIVGTLQIPVENVVILEDQDSFFKAVAEIVKAEDYANKRGETKKRCIVEHAETEVKNTIWDGMGLIETSVLPDWINGMALLRNHMFKMCGFRTRMQDFFRDWCDQTGNDYETYEIEDMFGEKHRLRDIAILSTDNAIKWKKFRPLMGDNPYEYWKNKINADGSIWGIVKTDHPSKLGNGEYQQMSYQFCNTLPCSKEEFGEIAKTSTSYVEKLKTNPDEFERFLRNNANEINHYLMMADLYDHNHEFANSKWFRNEKKMIINQYVYKLRNGKIFVNADNLTLCGNPYALLLYSVGEDWKKDPTLQPEDGTIQCYTKRFSDGDYLAGFRSPHNSPNNLVYLKNRITPEMEKYFDFSNNIMAVNCLETDIQSRANGCDFDSDFMFVTNQEQIVESARRCYQDFPTIVNDLKESGVTYDNTAADYAQMDNMMSRSQLGIGWSSNAAQLCMSYYWTELAKEKRDEELLKAYYDNFIILSVLAQVIIDGCKRVYEIDGLDEIKRIMDEPWMSREYVDAKGKVHKKDFPMFMKYTRTVPHTKNGEELPYDIVKGNKEKIKNRIDESITCPMNWLQEYLDKIQGAPTTNSTPTEDFFIVMDGSVNSHASKKIIDIIVDYSNSIKREMSSSDSSDELVETMVREMDSTINKLKHIKIKNLKTINRIIETALDLNGAVYSVNKAYQRNNVKYSRQILNCLYRMDKEVFLGNFLRNTNFSL